jgi:hypothetical protein
MLEAAYTGSDDSDEDDDDSDSAAAADPTDGDSSSDVEDVLFCDARRSRLAGVAALVGAAGAPPIQASVAAASSAAPQLRGESALNIFRARCRADLTTATLPDAEIKRRLDELDGAARAEIEALSTASKAAAALARLAAPRGSAGGGAAAKRSKVSTKQQRRAAALLEARLAHIDDAWRFTAATYAADSDGARFFGELPAAGIAAACATLEELGREAFRLALRAQEADAAHPRTLLARVHIVMQAISYSHAAYGTDAIAAQIGCNSVRLRCFFVKWYPLAYDANAPLLPSLDDVARVRPLFSEGAPLFSAKISHGELLKIVHVGGWAVFRCRQQVEERNELGAELRPLVMQAVDALIVQKGDAEADRPDLAAVDELERIRDNVDLARLGVLGQAVVVAVEGVVRAILCAEKASTFILLGISKAVLDSPVVAAAWEAALKARGVPISSATGEIARSLYVRLYLHSTYASIKRQLCGGHAKLAARERTAKFAKSQKKRDEHKGHFRKKLKGQTGRG